MPKLNLGTTQRSYNLTKMKYATLLDSKTLTFWMKNILVLIFLVCAQTSIAQTTSLNENMNTTCITGTNGPAGWATFNPISTPGPNGMWVCDPAYGRSGTTGVSCSGYYGSPGTFHLDTSILISPGLDLSHYATIYVNFDTKTTNINLGAKLELLVSKDSSMNADSSVHDTATVYNRTTSLMPLFGNGDESGWVTHQADLTPFKHLVPLYIGFRYVSASGSVGSRWYLDNVMTTTTPNAIGEVAQAGNNTISGNIADGCLTVFTSGNLQQGNYELALFDLNGRKLFTDKLDIRNSGARFTLNNIFVPPGIYVLKMSKESDFLTTRIVAW